MFTPIGFFSSQVSIVTDGLQQWIDPAIDDTADQSGNGRTAVLQGGLTTSAGEYVLDGTLNKYLDSGWAPDTDTNGFTISCWLKQTSSPTNNAQIMGNAGSSGTSGPEILSLFTLTGANLGKTFFNARYSLSAGDYYQLIVDSTNRIDSTWYYYTFSGNTSAGTINVYINDTLVNNDPMSPTGDTVATDGNTIVWWGRQNSGQTFNGRGGPVQLYTRILTADEISQNFNADKARFGY